MAAYPRDLSGYRDALKGAWRNISAVYSRHSHHLPAAVLVLLVLAYTTVFTATTFSEHNRHWYGNFDLGIFDQGMWLLSQFKEPYLTTRGLNLFGDHPTFIHLLVAPIYWIWDDVKMLLFFHTIALASGAIPIYLIARAKLRNDWTPLIICLSYLLLPALHFSNLDQGYHSESLAVPLILWGHYFITKKRQAAYCIVIFLAAMCKEEIALTLFLYGIYVALKYSRRIGLATSVFAVAWLLLVMNVISPHFNEEGAFYASRTIGSFGDTPQEKLGNALNASFMAKKLDTPENWVYVRKLLEPVGYLVILEPHAFLCAGSLWLNLVQDWAYAHQIQYHYVSPIIPIIYISLVEGLSRWRKNKTLTGILLGALLVSSIQGNYYFGPDQSTLRDIGRPVSEVMNFDRTPLDMRNLILLEEKIPPKASVSASYNLVPHLSHREKIYMFPNPFRVSYFGVADRATHKDKNVDYVLLDVGLLGDEVRFGTVDMVTKSGRYVMIDKYNQFELWRRIDV